MNYQALIETGDLSFLSQLSSVNAPLPGHNGENTLTLAVGLNQQNAITQLISQGVNMNYQRENDQFSCLHIAVMQMNSQLVQFLRNGGADWDVRSKKQNWTPVYLALQLGDPTLVGLPSDISILQACAQFNLPNTLKCWYKFTKQSNPEQYPNIVANKLNYDKAQPLLVAVKAGHISVVRRLLRYGASVFAAPNDEAPLTAAVKSGNLDMLKLLLQHTMKIYRQVKQGGSNAITDLSKDPVKDTSLMFVAVESGHHHIAKYLRETIGMQVENAKQTLYQAVERKDLDTIKYLLSMSLNLQDYDYNDILLKAAATKDLEVVKLLARSGCKLNHQDGDGKTALYHSVADGEIEIVKVLIEAGADIHQAKNGGFYPLYIGMFNGTI